MYWKQRYAAIIAGMIMGSLCSAAIGPVTAVEADNPPGSPPYNLLSITAGGVTVSADRLRTGTTTQGGMDGTATPEMDDFDINTALDWNLGPGNFWTVNFGGGLWTDTNGDAPDFFLFEYGGTDSPDVAAIMPDGSLGQIVNIPAQWADLGYPRDGAAAADPVSTSGTGQPIEGMSWAITDLLDASGNPLDNSSTILGITIVNRNGTDPTGLFAVVPPPGKAKNPQPADGETDVVRDVLLSWSPSKTAVTHDVYFGASFEDVNSRKLDAFVGPGLDVNAYDPEGLLDLEKTYYWCVDEVNTANPESPWQGDIWSFEIEPVSFVVPMEEISAAASSVTEDQVAANTVNGSGLNEFGEHGDSIGTMWVSSPTDSTPSIQYTLTGTYKLEKLRLWNHNSQTESLLGFGMKEALIEYSVDGETWIEFGTFEFAQASGLPTYSGFDVALDGVVAKHVRIAGMSNWSLLGITQMGLSEVRFFYIPTHARRPEPADGAQDQSPDIVLRWRAGREAAQHDVYLGTDENDLPLIENVTEGQLDMGNLGSLQLGQAYFWRVDEVNSAETPSVWEGNTWTFATPDALVVDDMEIYADKEGLWIWETWHDGFEDPDNGSTVGHGDLPETTLVNSGGKSMPFHFNNQGAAFSEATRTFEPPQDWARAGIQSLVFYFYQDPANTGNGQLYVKVNDVKQSHPAQDAVVPPGWNPGWQSWTLDLATLGANLTSVTKLAIGVEGGNAVGTLYVDDILLTKTGPAPETVIAWFEAEAAATKTAPFQDEADADASGGTYITTANDGVVGDSSSGIATYPVTIPEAGTYKLYGRVIEPEGGGSNSFWVRLPNAALNTAPLTANDGWINWNFAVGTTWHWDEVVNSDDGNIPIHYTLAPGPHTLEIAFREDGAQLDALALVQVDE